MDAARPGWASRPGLLQVQGRLGDTVGCSKALLQMGAAGEDHHHPSRWPTGSRGLPGDSLGTGVAARGTGCRGQALPLFAKQRGVRRGTSHTPARRPGQDRAPGRSLAGDGPHRATVPPATSVAWWSRQHRLSQEEPRSWSTGGDAEAQFTQLLPGPREATGLSPLPRAMRDSDPGSLAAQASPLAPHTAPASRGSA